jgi:hypothetical protein
MFADYGRISRYTRKATAVIKKPVISPVTAVMNWFKPRNTNTGTAVSNAGKAKQNIPYSRNDNWAIPRNNGGTASYSTIPSTSVKKKTYLQARYNR